jgi:hypothetical protein
MQKTSKFESVGLLPVRQQRAPPDWTDSPVKMVNPAIGGRPAATLFRAALAASVEVVLAPKVERAAILEQATSIHHEGVLEVLGQVLSAVKAKTDMLGATVCRARTAKELPRGYFSDICETASLLVLIVDRMVTQAASAPVADVGAGLARTLGITGCIDGSSGSGGGAGAGPGQGGRGCGPGGSSIAILTIRSTLLISESSVLTSEGGRGGSGGSRGLGGEGGLSDCLTWCAGAGGKGGNGGDGGRGGGGGGGSLVGLVKYESSVDLRDNDSWQVGPAGTGGVGDGSEATTGGSGISQRVFQVVIRSSEDQ